MAFMNNQDLKYHCSYFAGELYIIVLFVAAANNVPSITVNGSLTRRWTVLEESRVTFATSDPDNDTVTMFGFGLPSGSSLSRMQDSDLWEFVWTPTNMDPVELV